MYLLAQQTRAALRMVLGVVDTHMLVCDGLHTHGTLGGMAGAVACLAEHPTLVHKVVEF